MITEIASLLGPYLKHVEHVGRALSHFLLRRLHEAHALGLRDAILLPKSGFWIFSPSLGFIGVRLGGAEDGDQIDEETARKKLHSRHRTLLDNEARSWSTTNPIPIKPNSQSSSSPFTFRY